MNAKSHNLAVNVDQNNPEAAASSEQTSLDTPVSDLSLMELMLVGGGDGVVGLY